MIEMIPVTSSNIAAVGYDPETQVMRVEFHRSGLYELQDVPQAEYEMLIASASIGSTYASFFKDRYETRKL